MPVGLIRLLYRRRWWVIGIWLVVFISCVGFAMRASSVLGPGEFIIRNSDSARVATILDRLFHQNDQRITFVVVANRSRTVTSSDFQHTVASIAGRMAADRGMRIVVLENPLLTHNRRLIARDGHAVALMASSNLTEASLENQIDHLRSVVRTPGYSTLVTGTAALNHDFAVRSMADLSRAEVLSLGLLAVILVLVFGTLVASGIPLLLGVFAIVLSLAAVFFLGHVVTMSIYVQNVVTFLGLGIGIDYSLFLVYRFREELHRRPEDVEGAVIRTMQTVGRAVFFSGLTVAIGLSSLLLTNVEFIQSMGLGGMLVPVVSVVVALTLLPAVLSVVGPGINRLRVLPGRFLDPRRDGAWQAIAREMMRRPVLYGGIALILLLAAAFPATQLALASGSMKNAPPGLESVAGLTMMQRDFVTQPDPMVIVVQHHAPGSLLQPAQLAGLRRLEETIRQDPETASIVGPGDFIPPSVTPTPAQVQSLVGRLVSADLRTAIITVAGRHDVGTVPAEKLVRRTRARAAIFGRSFLAGDTISVGGGEAGFVDFNDALYARFPTIIAIVLILTYGFLFFAFRSMVVPLKAVLLNLLSVGAAYGILQLVFQRGIGAVILGFTPESGVASWVPVMLFAFLFGLSMDYEVFLLSRMRERWLATGDNRESVAFGLARTGRLITSAAIIMVVAFTGFLIGGLIQIKELGLGMIVAIAVDASLIRIVLVPSLMRLLGDANWWVPGFLVSWSRRGSTWETEDQAGPRGTGKPRRRVAS